MKLVLAAAAAAAFLIPAAASAQTAPAPAAAPAPAPAAAAKYDLDTPLEVLVADPKAKAVLDADLGGDVTQNPNWEMAKGMSLRQVQPYASDKLTDAVLAKIEADLAAIK